MIWESWYWRSDLQKRAASLQKRMAQVRWADASLARCEQTILLGFFEVRKLIDSRKLTKDFGADQVKVHRYPCIASGVTWMNRRRVDEFFDLSKRAARTVTVEYLCNQMIHSHVFELLFDESHTFCGVLVASDRTRNKEMLEVSAKTIVDVFDRAGKGEDDQTISVQFDDKTEDYVFRREPQVKRAISPLRAKD